MPSSHLPPASHPRETDLPIPLLLQYRAFRQRSRPTDHERNVALLDAARIRHLPPVPAAYVGQTHLSPASPPPAIHFSSADHQAAFSREDEFFATATLSTTEFTLLHAHVFQTLRTSRTPSHSTSPHVHPMPTELSTSDQLLLWLCFCCGDRNASLSLHFNHLHRTTIYRYIDHVTFCINDALNELIQWPSSAERQQWHGRMSVCTGAVAVLDGTHCPIQAPVHYNNQYYSGYKCKHTQNYLVCVNYFGLVLSIDGPHIGRNNDRDDYTMSDLFNNVDKYLASDEYILADGGFMDGPQLLVPIHKTVIDKQTDADGRAGMEAYNAEFTANRLIVEDVFGWLKGRAHVLHTEWARQVEKQADIFNAACRVHNFRRILRIDHALQQSDNDANQSA